MTQATPTKLRTGAWGARTSGTVAEGDTIQITARSGKSWTATVSRVVWTDGSIAICATDKAPAVHRTSRSTSSTSRAWYENPDHKCYSCRCHEDGAPFDGCQRCFCDGDM